MKIKVKCKDTGKIFDNNMSKDDSIIEIHFCTSYTQAIVQEKKENEVGKTIWPTRSLELETIGSKTNYDFTGEWIED